MTENKNLEERCFYKKAFEGLIVEKSYCISECDGYDRLCPNYFVLYSERLFDGFQEGGEKR